MITIWYLFKKVVAIAKQRRQASLWSENFYYKFRTFLSYNAVLTEPFIDN